MMFHSYVTYVSLPEDIPILPPKIIILDGKSHYFQIFLWPCSRAIYSNDLPEDKYHQIALNHHSTTIQPPLNHHFPVVFLWFGPWCNPILTGLTWVLLELSIWVSLTPVGSAQSSAQRVDTVLLSTNSQDSVLRTAFGIGGGAKAKADGGKNIHP